MKKFVISSFLFLVLVMLSSWGTPRNCMNFDLTVVASFEECNEQYNSDQQAKSVYTCPMHPEIVQEKPGKCPKCGMDLTAKEVKKEVYICPMHSEVSQDKPGKCPKCGMNLKLKEPAKKADPPKK